MRRHRVIAAILLLAAAEARAEPPGKTPPRRKSPQVAFLSSVGATAAGGLVTALAISTDSSEVFIAGAAGLWVGPSVGRWYAGARRGGTLFGMLARPAAAGILVLGLREDAQPVDVCDEPDDDCTAHDAKEAEQDRKAQRFYIAAAALWVGSSIYDIVRAPLDARDFNREHAVTVAPSVVGGQGGSALAPGLALSGRF